MRKNSLFMHSGGVTSVVNTVVSTLHQELGDHLYICPFGVKGLFDSFYRSCDFEWATLAQSPAMAFGSSRERVPNIEDDAEFYQTLFTNLAKHQIGTLYCNGGNNSQYIAHRIDQAAKALAFPLNVIGIPKTIDNDVIHTDTAIGFGSAAKYTAVSCLEASLDLAAMCQGQSKVLIYQTMGRNAGWLSASSALAKQHPFAGPHIILVPEATFTKNALLERIQFHIKEHQHVVICLAEGVTLFNDSYPNAPSPAYQVAQLILEHLKLSSHVVIPDYLQRAARHLASKTDIEQAVAMSQEAIRLAKKQQSGIMVGIGRVSNTPYTWRACHVNLDQVAGRERCLPQQFITDDGLYINQSGIDYIMPLIQGESFPTFENGLPNYTKEIYQCLAKLQASN
ncbi:diphosphate--fructose-6-phosphate 1-phosphotransferase [Gammaproteobacteria bacterium]|nr:diphosphate--fructose-6-phosphate 1-phosphotransferase [Gammaproteobacteria bacterium]